MDYLDALTARRSRKVPGPRLVFGALGALSAGNLQDPCYY